jgi:hypothetical protein
MIRGELLGVAAPIQNSQCMLTVIIRTADTVMGDRRPRVLRAYADRTDSCARCVLKVRLCARVLTSLPTSFAKVQS